MLMARDFNCGLEIAVYARTVYVRRVVEPEGVIKFPPALSRNASVHAATFSHFRHIEPRSGWFGHRRGVETAPCLGCLRRLPPEGGVPGSREEAAPCLAVRAREAGARAGLASAGCSADAPACGQAVGSRLARTNLDLGRGRWIRGGSERMNGQAKDLSDHYVTLVSFVTAEAPFLENSRPASRFLVPTAAWNGGWQLAESVGTPSVARRVGLSSAPCRGLDGWLPLDVYRLLDAADLGEVSELLQQHRCDFGPRRGDEGSVAGFQVPEQRPTGLQLLQGDRLARGFGIDFDGRTDVETGERGIHHVGIISIRAALHLLEGLESRDPICFQQQHVGEHLENPRANG